MDHMEDLKEVLKVFETKASVLRHGNLPTEPEAEKGIFDLQLMFLTLIKLF